MPREPRHPDLEGIEPVDAEAADRKVRLRRLKRRLKAAASLVIASAAGAFLACTRGDKQRPPPAPNPMTHETSNLPAPPRDAAAERSTALVPSKDASAPHDAAAKGAVDKREHRKGMPVRDNLLE
ncbi:MAG TPA: hypothetical protein VKQ32_07775 [Polyangia bacterium]|nr:hypothetical protein [Polyangia bacterium]